MGFLPLMVCMLSVDTLLFHSNLFRQAGAILWLAVAVLAILCRLVLRGTTQQQQPLRVRDTLHIMDGCSPRSKPHCMCLLSM